ncbi:hypothetical protein CPLU01_05280 [Colletotrichum plurivorum]|uniref:Uncharacterized protein n=1 Tax=Colletotrichum plurivorum TaxID=2175906 RepID=A0A8H6KM17_9PEZI|nr:hypothetical protein CPLU01_05280 [Colletotrichum plurivorum]
MIDSAVNVDDSTGLDGILSLLETSTRGRESTARQPRPQLTCNEPEEAAPFQKVDFSPRASWFPVPGCWQLPGVDAPGNGRALAIWWGATPSMELRWPVEVLLQERFLTGNTVIHLGLPPAGRVALDPGREAAQGRKFQVFNHPISDSPFCVWSLGYGASAALAHSQSKTSTNTKTSVSTPSGWAVFVGVIVGRCHAKLGATLTLNLAMTLCSVSSTLLLRSGLAFGATDGTEMADARIPFRDGHCQFPALERFHVSPAHRLHYASVDGPECQTASGWPAEQELASSALLLEKISNPPHSTVSLSDAYRLQITDDRECLSLDPCLAARHAASHRNPLRNLSTRPSRCGLRTVTPARLSLPPLVIPDARAACWNGTALELTDMTDNGSVIWQKHTNEQL